MIRLHHCHQTRSMRSLWLLHEIGVPFEVEVHPFGRELRAPEYLAKHPAGRVPSLEIDGEIVFESGAIAEILTERFPEAGLGRLPGHPERLQFLNWLNFAETITASLGPLAMHHIMLREDWMRSPTVMKLEAGRVGKCYEAVEARLEGREYLLDGGFSAADIGVGQAVYMGTHFVRLARYPRLTEYYGRITARPAFAKSLPPPGAKGLYEREFYAPWPEVPPDG